MNYLMLQYIPNILKLFRQATGYDTLNSQIHFHTQPNCIQDIKSLQIQTLNSRQIKSVISLCPKIQKLNITTKIRQDLWKEFSSIKFLKELMVKVPYEIPNKLQNYSHLKVLIIQTNCVFSTQQIQTIVDSIPNLQHIGQIKQLNQKGVQILLNMKNLKGLTLQSIDNKFISAPLNMIENLNNIKHLVISNRNKKLKSNINILMCFKNLQILDFQNAKTKSFNQSYFFGFCTNTLKQLNLNNIVYSKKYQQTFQNLVKQIGLLSQLQQLYLNSCNITDNNLILLFSEIKNITKLSLESNKISDIGVEYVIQKYPNIRYLNLNLSNLSTKSIKNIQQKLKQISQLQVFQCNLNTKGAYYLSKMKHLKNLNAGTYFGPTTNKIGNVGAIKLLRNLKNTLIKLSYDTTIKGKQKRNILLMFSNKYPIPFNNYQFSDCSDISEESQIQSSND